MASRAARQQELTLGDLIVAVDDVTSSPEETRAALEQLLASGTVRPKERSGSVALDLRILQSDL